jgi:hypothetical protein
MIRSNEVEKKTNQDRSGGSNDIIMRRRIKVEKQKLRKKGKMEKRNTAQITLEISVGLPLWSSIGISPALRLRGVILSN